jgi:hypothetical protein
MKALASVNGFGTANAGDQAQESQIKRKALL